MPLVSICLPTLNARQFLKPRMESILSQTETDWELIVCDSFSDDGTWEYFQKFKGDPRIRLYQVPREGLYAGWNECLKRVTGEYVYIATADDTCDPALLEKMARMLERIDCRGQKSLEIAMCQFDFIDSNDRPDIRLSREIPLDFLGAMKNQSLIIDGHLAFVMCLLCGVPWTTMTSILFKKSLFDKAGLFKTDCGVFADRYWAMKACINSGIIYLPEKLATWRIHKEQASSGMETKLRKKNIDNIEQLLNEYADRIPADWKKDADWKRKLTWLARRDYYSSFNLNRDAMSKHFSVFAGGIIKCLIKEPRYLLARCCDGFSWDSEYYANQSAYLRKLIEEWNLSWPPIAVK